MPEIDLGSVVGPQGPQGAAGATGAQGEQGIQGVPGEAGKSAYQAAKDGGYTGTEAEFNAIMAIIDKHASRHKAGGADPLTPWDIGAASGNNLLDNWYFADPINQRGQTEYSGSGYTIDRWYTGSARQITAITGESVRCTHDNSATGTIWFRTKLEKNSPPGTYTASFLIRKSRSDLSVRAGVGGVSDCKYLANHTEWQLVSGTYTKSNGAEGVQITSDSSVQTGDWIEIKAVKLELGSQQTLAHQDADGNWVLNDPPPNKALELAKCQRYQVVLRSAKKMIGWCSAYAADSFYFCIPLPVQMAKTPTIISSAELRVMNKNLIVDSAHFASVSDVEIIDGMLVGWGGISGVELTPGSVYGLGIYTNNVIVDANF